MDLANDEAPSPPLLAGALAECYEAGVCVEERNLDQLTHRFSAWAGVKLPAAQVHTPQYASSDCTAKLGGILVMQKAASCFLLLPVGESPSDGLRRVTIGAKYLAVRGGPHTLAEILQSLAAPAIEKI